MFQSDDLVVRRATPDTWYLEHELIYYGKDDTIVVPAGYETDFASVPRIITWMVPKYGKYTMAAILHDYLCDAMNSRGYAEIRSKPSSTSREFDVISSRDVDGLFRRIMREQGVPVLQRWIMWAGVRVGALLNHKRRPGVLRDLPLTALILLATAPFALIPVLGILMALAVYRPLEWVFG